MEAFDLKGKTIVVTGHRIGKNIFYTIADDHIHLMLKGCVEHVLENEEINSYKQEFNRRIHACDFCPGDYKQSNSMPFI